MLNINRLKRWIKSNSTHFLKDDSFSHSSPYRWGWMKQKKYKQMASVFLAWRSKNLGGIQLYVQKRQQRVRSWSQGGHGMCSASHDTSVKWPANIIQWFISQHSKSCTRKRRARKRPKTLSTCRGLFQRTALFTFSSWISAHMVDQLILLKGAKR